MISMNEKVAGFKTRRSAPMKRPAAASDESAASSGNPPAKSSKQKTENAGAKIIEELGSAKVVGNTIEKPGMAILRDKTFKPLGSAEASGGAVTALPPPPPQPVLARPQREATVMEKAVTMFVADMGPPPE